MICSRADLSAVGKIVSEIFEISVEFDSISEVMQGTNRGFHFVATTTGGRKFGFKLFDGSGSHLGAEKDKLMADVAIKIGMPNTCRVERTDKFDFVDHFKGRMVSVTEWLPHSISLKHLLDEHDGNEILASFNEFHFQAGIWIAFGYSFAIADRGLGNWVWDHSEKKLAMIDMEFALNDQYCLADYNEFFGRYLTKSKLVRNRQIEAVRNGFLSGWAIIAEHRDTIETMLREQTFSSAYLLPWDSDKGELFDAHLSNY